MGYGQITISRGNSTVNFYLRGWYKSDTEDITTQSIGYGFYPLREAIRRFKETTGLKGKHGIDIVDER